MPSVICSSADRALWSEPEPITRRGEEGWRHKQAWSTQQMLMVTVTADKNHTRWASYFHLKVLSGGRVLQEAMEEPYGGHVLESIRLKDCPREIKESESTGWFAGCFCSLNSTSKIIPSNRFKGTLTKLPAACLPSGKPPRSIHGEDILHDNVTHSYNAFNSLSHPNTSSPSRLKDVTKFC